MSHEVMSHYYVTSSVSDAIPTVSRQLISALRTIADQASCSKSTFRMADSQGALFGQKRTLDSEVCTQTKQFWWMCM